MNELKEKFLKFMAIWMIPSQTPLYIIMEEILNWGILTSYIASALISGTAAFTFLHFWNKEKS